MDFFSDFGGTSALKPTLFELIAQEQLHELLQPALKYVLAVFAHRHPRYLIPIVNRHEEFYALLLLVLERHYLRIHNASFAENFYGLKRRRRPVYETERARAAVGGVQPEENLRSREIWRSLVFLVGLPYIRAKARDHFESLGGGIDPEVLNEDDGGRAARALTDQGFRGRLRRAYRAAYPWLNLGFEGWLLAYNVAYLFDRTPFYRPWLGWVGVDLRRLGIDDYRAAAQAASASTSSKPSRRTLAALLRSLPSAALSSLRLLLPTFIFAIKFLEWWYSPSSPARALTAQPKGPPLPPPRLLPPHPRGIPVSTDVDAYGTCPICKEQWKNPTALPSGYIFCFRCAFDVVEREGRCPVTLVPAKVWQLRKVLV